MSLTKPCPFCGRKPTIIQQRAPTGLYGFHGYDTLIQCQYRHCHASGASVSTRLEGRNLAAFKETTISLWNIRRP